MDRFTDRASAGELLGRELARHRSSIVLGIARGGAVVGAAVATGLGAEFGVIVVESIGDPLGPGLKIGAVADGGEPVFDDRILGRLRIPEPTLDAAIAAATTRMRQRADMIGRWEPSSLQGRSVVVIDDGIATGLTMKAALGAVREAAPEEIVVAAPVADPAAVDELAFLADGVVTLVQPDRFGSLLDWYEDGTVVTDGDVASLVG